MKSHTPGPWAFDGAGRIDALNFRVPSPHKLKNNDGSERIFMLGLVALPYACGDGTFEANARLIAAAPELLADLREAAATLRRYEALHRAKGTEDSDAKAEVNAALATRFEATIAKTARSTP
ncbi:hypothetical protein SAMN05216344_102208 [Polaromonas sp. OV174]|uniref:hypothetical protein n=1 Tax=Polaromonas sp. OV174 TaxID=1855300 RepID=UPI0008E7F23B|nr:hypothetical protein [Polaromonas sp. OV174]SFB74620.1 hypothetical protein SAMN05216344_102208 [Polaromonas sp. OV174]